MVVARKGWKPWKQERTLVFKGYKGLAHSGECRNESSIKGEYSSGEGQYGIVSVCDAMEIGAQFELDQDQQRKESTYCLLKLINPQLALSEVWISNFWWYSSFNRLFYTHVVIQKFLVN